MNYGLDKTLREHEEQRRVDADRVALASRTEPKGPSEDAIRTVCDEIKEMLVAKNKAYGDSALKPLRVFSTCDAIEQIKVRIDDKLTRLQKGSSMPDESLRDTRKDLIGYLVLLEIAERRAE